MILTRTGAPNETPVSLADVKAHLRVGHNDDDSVLLDLIDAATASVEEMCGRALVTQTWVYSFCDPGRVVSLPKLPVQTVTAITYYDRDGVVQSADVNDFYLFKSDDFANLEPKSGSAWPQTYDRDDAITVTFVAGYGSASDVPAPIRTAITMLVGHWYDGAPADDVPFGVSDLVGLYRLVWVA